MYIAVQSEAALKMTNGNAIEPASYPVSQSSALSVSLSLLLLLSLSLSVRTAANDNAFFALFTFFVHES